MDVRDAISGTGEVEGPEGVGRSMLGALGI